MLFILDLAFLIISTKRLTFSKNLLNCQRTALGVDVGPHPVSDTGSVLVPRRMGQFPTWLTAWLSHLLLWILSLCPRPLAKVSNSVLRNPLWELLILVVKGALDLLGECQVPAYTLLCELTIRRTLLCQESFDSYRRVLPYHKKISNCP